MARLTFLGTGTSTGVPYIGCGCEVCESADYKDKRLRCSSLLEVDGKSILIDCGPDFRQQALTNKITKIDAVLLTHMHVDHVGGLDDLRPFGEVDIYAEKRTADSVRRMYSYCFVEDKYPGVPSLVLHEIDNAPFLVAGQNVVPIRAFHHHLPIFGFRLNNFAYLTDLKTIEEKEFYKLKGLDVLVLGMLRYEQHLSHLSFDEAMNLVDKVKPKRVYFVHLSHDFGLHEVEQRKMPDNVYVAYDGLQISF